LSASFTAANVERFSGFAETYDRHRPSPPEALPALLCQYAGIASASDARPALVVDLGSGTGLSTRLWSGHADHVIGIEPNPEMRAQAARETTAPTIEYREGHSAATGLPDASADIVMVAQALHWMEPTSTFAEVARILRPGGVFAAVDNDWPPLISPQIDQQFYESRRRERTLVETGDYEREIRSWAKPGHLGRMEKSGQFSMVREFFLHKQDSGDAARMIGLVLSQGGTQTLLKAGMSEDDIGLTGYRAALDTLFGGVARAWWWTFRVRIGVR